MPGSQYAFQIERADNVATALVPLSRGCVTLLGNVATPEVKATEGVPSGHKIALRDIAAGEDVIKYGIPIGRAIKDIKKGGWVHLHCIASVYDERSSHLDPVTGAPSDISYE